MEKSKPAQPASQPSPNCQTPAGPTSLRGPTQRFPSPIESPVHGPLASSPARGPHSAASSSSPLGLQRTLAPLSLPATWDPLVRRPLPRLRVARAH